MTKLERASQAQEHTEMVRYKYRDEISQSIENTRCYTSANLKTVSVKEGNVNLIIKLVDMSTIYCILRHTDTRNRTAVLNFASYKNPGGGFLSGAFAQEEALCHESTLFPVLKYFDDSFYAYNRNHTKDGLYESRLLYSPGIIIDREGYALTKKVDVITYAAANFDVYRKTGKNTYEINREVMVNRVKDVFRVATLRNVDTLILGAWGCGVFGQDPYLISEMMLDAAEQYPIKRVFFAIPDRNSENYIAFWETMKDRDYPVPDREDKSKVKDISQPRIVTKENRYGTES